MSDDKPDLLAGTNRLMWCLGGVAAALTVSDRPGDRILLCEVWETLPLVKALGRLAQAHPEEALALWESALREPMPFDQPPVGKPGDVG